MISKDLNMIVARVVGVEESLLFAAGRRCFGKLPVTPLRELAKHLGIVLTDKGSLFCVIKDLLAHLFPGMSEQERLKILCQRSIVNAPWDHLVDDEVAEDLVGLSEDAKHKEIHEAVTFEGKGADTYEEALHVEATRVRPLHKKVLKKKSKNQTSLELFLVWLQRCWKPCCQRVGASGRTPTMVAGN